MLNAPRPIADSFESLVCDLHRLERSDHGIPGLYSLIYDIERAAKRLRSGNPTRGEIREAIAAIDLLEDLADYSGTDHWIRDRVAMIRMDIDDVRASLARIMARPSREA